jgi:hypothetical protein
VSGTTFNRTLTIAYTGGGGATVTPSVVNLSGTRVNMAVNPASLTFSGQAVGTTSGSQTLTVRNSTGGTRSLSIAVTAPFLRPAGPAGGSCSGSLGAGNSCTINVRFAAPATAGTSQGTVTITTNGGFNVANSPVSLTGVAQ